MKRIAMIGMLMLVVCIGAKEPARAEVVNNGIVLIISSDKKLYKRDERIMLDLKIMNKGKDVKLIYRHFIYHWRMKLFVSDEGNKELPWKGFGLSPGLPIEDDFVMLGNNQYFGEIEQLNGDYLNYKLDKGKYNIRAEFDSYEKDILFQTMHDKGKDIPDDIKKNYWSGSIRSNILHIEVRE